MNSKAAPATVGRYVLVFILLMVFCQAYGQEAATTEPVQNKISENIQDAQQKAEELQDKAFSKIDSLSNKSANLLHTTTDSLNNLSSAIQGEKSRAK